MVSPSCTLIGRAWKCTSYCGLVYFIGTWRVWKLL